MADLHPGDGGGATPSQRLLQSLRTSEAARKQRMADTAAGKLRAARDKLPGISAKHPQASDQQFLGDPTNEVHQLPADVQAAKPSLEGIRAMLLRKADRHEAAWQGYLGARDAAVQQLQQASERAVQQLQERLATSSADIERQMEVLQEAQLMVLQESDVHQVWTALAASRQERRALVEQLGDALAAAEGCLVRQVEAQLDLTEQLLDIAHLDPGQVQHVIEQETLDMNVQVLDRKSLADGIMKQLLLAEIKAEQRQRQRWEAARVEWRILHSQHAVDVFKQLIASRRFSEPGQRLACCAELRAAQAAAHAALADHCARIPGLAPPHMSLPAAQQWAAGFEAWRAAWSAEQQRLLDKLQQQEDATEAQARAALDELRGELAGYGGWAEEELERQLQEQCQPVLQERRAAVERLLAGVGAFLARQSQEWGLLGEVLGRWLSKVAEAVERHQRRADDTDAEVRRELAEEQRRFEEEDEGREAALDASVELLKVGSSEAQLDQRLAAALDCLKGIQAGYKEHHAEAVSIIRQHPPAVQAANQQHSQQLRGLLCVGERCAGRGVQEGGGPPDCRDAAAAPSAAPPLLPRGCRYSASTTLWRALRDGTPKPWVQAFQEQQAAALQDAAGSSADGTEDRSPAAPAAPAADKPGKPAAKGKQSAAAIAEAEAAAAAAEASAAAEAAARQAAAAAALAAVEAGPDMPTSLDGAPLCERLPAPDSLLTSWLQQLQVDLLADMDEQASRTQGAAESWAAEQEGEATETLDGQLRRHRPRAGQLSEDVRTRRSSELVDQRRQVEAHMRRQSKAVKQQQAAFDDGLRQLHKDADAWTSKLQGYSRLLGAALSSKGIDICWREAQALLAKQQRQLTARVAALRQLLEEGCAAVAATNQRFGQQQLKGVAEGGRYAEDSIATYQAGIAGIDRHMAGQQQQQQSRLEAAEAQVLEQLQKALAGVEALLPAHKQDMGLIEAMDRALEASRKKTQAELARSSAAADSIGSLLSQLSSLLTRAAAARSASGDAPADGLARQLVYVVNEVRLQALRQAQSLGCLQSTGLQPAPISLELQGDVTPLPQAGAPTAASAAAPDPAAAGARAGSAGADKAQAKGKPLAAPAAARPSSAAPQPAPAAAAALQAGVQAALDGCKAEVQAAAGAYYTAKAADRPVCYPAKLPPAEAELLEQLQRKLQQLQQLLEEHMLRTTGMLRSQVIQANRLLEAVPAAVLTLLAAHHAGVAAEQHQAVRGRAAAARKLLVDQLEQHKEALHPSMLHPNRQHELQALQDREAARQASAAAHGAACAGGALALLQHHTPQLLARLQQAGQLLLQLLDGCVQPQDLPAAAADQDPGAGLQRRTLRQLQQMALAQQEVEPGQAGPAGAAPGITPAPAAKPKPAAGAAKPAAAGKADAAGAGAQQASGRPFATAVWVLEAGQLDAAALGWAEEDSAALGLAAGVMGSAAPPPPDTSVTSCDTPCHRAVLRAYRAARLTIRQVLAEQLQQHRQQLLGWAQHESLWAASWSRMLQELDTV